MSTKLPTSTDTNHEQTHRLTLPYIDTSVEIKGVITFDNARSFAVPLAALLLALVAWSVNATVIALPSFLIGALSLGIVLYFTYTNPYYLSTRERIENWLESRRLQQRFPYNYRETLGRQIHGVERFYPDGTAKMTDGRRVGLIGIEGMNTAQMTAGERDSIVRALTSGIDERIKNLSFSIYATSGDFDAEGIVDPYTARVEGTDKWRGQPLARTERATRYVRELLADVADWFVETDSPTWSANNWEYYVTVSVHQYEVSSAATTSDSSRFERLVSSVTGADNTTDETAFEPEMQAKLDERMSTIENALTSVDSAEIERASVLDHTRLLLRYWSGEPSLSLGDETRQAMADDDNRVGVGETPTERLLSPGEFDTANGRVVVGDELCKTFCVMDWPVNPNPMFLRQLFTMQKANVDVRIHVSPENKQKVIQDLEVMHADVESEQRERVQNTDASKIQIETDKGAVKYMYSMLHNTTAQPWSVSMYVTVRVGPTEACEYAQQTGRSVDDLYLAKVRALEDACEDVLEVLTGAPAELGVRQPTSNAAALKMFESASPTGADLYHEDGGKPKRTRMLGGAVAAMFPWCGGVMQEQHGLRFGRNTQNGSAIFADPFKRGAPHLLTLGQTRSGKTYSVETALSEWFNSDPTRTLIVCDTEQGFEGLTQLCGGKHIIVDGKQTINPFDIKQPPKRVREGSLGQSSHFQMKLNEVTSFFSGILRAQGIDPSRYVSTIEDAVQEAYENAGITRDPDTHVNRSPTIDDFLSVLTEMLDDPARFTFTGHEREAERRVSVVSDLLDKLSGFKPGRKYNHMVGETETDLLDREVNMAYIDLSQFNEASEAEKSVMLHLIFGQVYQKVKRTRGEVIFLIDEAHFLLHSEEMIEYLQDAARSWARYDAALWFVTQSPREFIQRAKSIGGGQENQRRTILDQCSIIQTFRTPRIEPELLVDGLGQNRIQADFVRNSAATGKSTQSYSECLVQFQDRKGWWKSRIQASPFQDLLWNYASRRHGDFERYIVDNWDGLSPIPEEIEAGSESEPEAESPANTDNTSSTENGEVSSSDEQEEQPNDTTPATDGGDDSAVW